MGDGTDPGGSHRVVWQITEGGPEAGERFLRSLTNLLADLEGEGVEVEVVAQGPGLDLLLPRTGLAEQVEGLRGRGVRFLACENTLRSRQVGVDDLLPGVRSVTSAVGHLVRRQSQGWSYLRA